MIRNLALDETELAVRDAVTRRLKDGLAPTSSAPTPYEAVWAALADLSFLSVPLDEAQGGLGGGLSDAAIVLEPLGRCGVAVPFLDGICGPAALLSRLPVNPVLTELIKVAAAGGAPLAIAWTEADQGWDRHPVSTKAVRDGDGWRITGLKLAVRWAAQSGGLLVSANCLGSTSVFFIPRDAIGVAMVPCRTADGQQAADVMLTNVALPATARLDEDDATEALNHALDALAALSLAEAAGAMDACLDMTVGYLKTRQQFGAPLSRQQALQHRMADMYAACETAWSMAVDAATALAPTVSPIDRATRVSAAKAHVGPSGRRVAQEAVHLHGAIGMTMDYPLGRLLARLTLIDLGNGDADWHLARLAALLDGAS
ncbi:acyl-CoA dehydrogenase family protein [Mesorhizobium sp. B2-4-6]|uniref:acyl-CoA dehydrogenase family protein n=1 Tax=Mesorhizobium sp. B2-4-6 TaxID=2589943 RepID=UPI001126D08C|nr:acyl-CoA dehydrogenase family protein [Mesorhizobium sp. B2-4-6]TPL43517.1 pimeloyl-CoA dehydrogenase small subunit [Mesorhizobium sp. B2-4-6]